MKPEDYARRWTDAQWDDAERVEVEVKGMLGGDTNPHLICLVIEERKVDPATTVQDCAWMALTLGAETMLQARHEARRLAAKKPAVKKPSKKQGVRGVSLRES